eukprot:254484-Chlamydomonas_euryale.AAC.1
MAFKVLASLNTISKRVRGPGGWRRMHRCPLCNLMKPGHNVLLVHPDKAHLKLPKKTRNWRNVLLVHVSLPKHDHDGRTCNLSSFVRLSIASLSRASKHVVHNAPCGASVWTQCVEPVCGPSVWTQCVEPVEPVCGVFGASVRTQCVEPVCGPSGASVWSQCVEPLEPACGASVWSLWMQCVDPVGPVCGACGAMDPVRGACGASVWAQCEEPLEPVCGPSGPSVWSLWSQYVEPVDSLVAPLHAHGVQPHGWCAWQCAVALIARASLSGRWWAAALSTDLGSMPVDPRADLQHGGGSARPFSEDLQHGARSRGPGPLRPSAALTVSARTPPCLCSADRERSYPAVPMQVFCDRHFGGINYPVGGVGLIAENLADGICEHGGTVVYKANVKVRGDRDGRTHQARCAPHACAARATAIAAGSARMRKTRGVLRARVAATVAAGNAHVRKARCVALVPQLRRHQSAHELVLARRKNPPR